MTGSSRKAVRHAAFKCVNTALCNFKSAFTGALRNVSFAHAPRALAEFDYRYNRRDDLAAMISRLAWAVAHALPMPYRLLKLTEGCG
jgi:hypothetical protein